MTGIEKGPAKKARQHTVYKNAAGKRVPGVTTITGVMDKPALVRWANKIGLEGIEVGKYVDELATTGTLAHAMVENYINKILDASCHDLDLNDYTPNQISLAENAVVSFYEWEKGKEITYIATEQIMVSESMQVGGTSDIIARINGVLTLLDLKTCKAVYADHFTQVGGGYYPILRENGHDIQDVRILRIGRDESEGFDDVKVPHLDLHMKRFKICRELYTINAEIRKSK